MTMSTVTVVDGQWTMVMRLRWLLLLLLLLLLCGGGGGARAAWVDPDTPRAVRESVRALSKEDRREYTLVFSDEFEVEGRRFGDGEDPRWTALEKNDYTNAALHYYAEKNVRTSTVYDEQEQEDKGVLNITTASERVAFKAYNDNTQRWDSATKSFTSGMVQSWDKFCFTGGIIEVSARMPGDAFIGGLWPAMWLMGNLARATYVSSSDFVWPWSYDTCNRDMQTEQELSACNRVNHFGMHPKQGRGAPEVDILEVMPGREQLRNTPIHRPYFSTSLQVSPALPESVRPLAGFQPSQPELWYDADTLHYGENTSLNIFFYGGTLNHPEQHMSYATDAVSANTNLNEDYFENFHTYRLEWEPGHKGYLRWFLDDKYVFGISHNTLNKTGAIIPEEPMYILFDTAMSTTWGFPTPCPAGCKCDCYDCRDYECRCGLPMGMCSMLPANFLIDYVRVYQPRNHSKHTVTCSPPSYPTRKFIQAHEDRYKELGDKHPLKPVPTGGAPCTHAADCGGGSDQDAESAQGFCKTHKHRFTLLGWVPGLRRASASRPDPQRFCKCNKGWTGPRCLSAMGHDAAGAGEGWPAETDASKLTDHVAQPYMPLALRWFLGLLGGALATTVAWKYLDSKWVRRRYTHIPNHFSRRYTTLSGPRNPIEQHPQLSISLVISQLNHMFFQENEESSPPSQSDLYSRHGPADPIGPTRLDNNDDDDNEDGNADDSAVDIGTIVGIGIGNGSTGSNSARRGSSGSGGSMRRTGNIN